MPDLYRDPVAAGMPHLGGQALVEPHADPVAVSVRDAGQRPHLRAVRRRRAGRGRGELEGPAAPRIGHRHRVGAPIPDQRPARALGGQHPLPGLRRNRVMQDPAVVVGEVDAVRVHPHPGVEGGGPAGAEQAAGPVAGRVDPAQHQREHSGQVHVDLAGDHLPADDVHGVARDRRAAGPVVLGRAALVVGERIVHALPVAAGLGRAAVIALDLLQASVRMQLVERVGAVRILFHRAADVAGDPVVHLPVELVEHLRDVLAHALAELVGAFAQSLADLAAHADPAIPPTNPYPHSHPHPHSRLCPARPGTARRTPVK